MKYYILFLLILYFSSCYFEKTTNVDNIDLSFLKKQAPNINNGKNIFDQTCKICHLYGTADATILSDKESWKNLLNKKGFEEIYINVLNGFNGKKGAMPAKGGCLQCSNIDLFDAIYYILAVNELSPRN